MVEKKWENDIHLRWALRARKNKYASALIFQGFLNHALGLSQQGEFKNAKKQIDTNPY
jgi:hypothetical protein